MEIVIADHLDLAPEILEEIGKLGHLIAYDDQVANPDELLRRIQNAEIITAKWSTITQEIIENAPASLKYIILPAVGFDRINGKAAREKGITVINCPTHNGAAVANLTIGLLLNLTRQITKANADLKNNIWNPFRYTGIEITGKRLGIVGYGNIGKQVAALAEKLGMKIAYVNSQSSQEEIDSLLKESDIVSLHVPLTDQTRHLLDEKRLRLMKKESYLVNTARGAVIDQKALLQLLKEGHFAGVALDVFEGEPSIGSILSEEMKELISIDRVLATPHIAFNSKEAWKRLGDELVANIRSCTEGNPINVVN